MKKLLLSLIIIFSLPINIIGCTNVNDKTSNNNVNIQNKNTNENKVTSDDTSNQPISIEEEIKGYLKTNYSKIDGENNDDYTSFSLLQDELKDNYLFLNGEGHNTGGNYKFQAKLLKYLNKNEGVKYFLTEHPFPGSNYFNEYLKTGDITKLDFIFKHASPKYIHNQDYYDMWKSLGEYNKTLPAEDKIQVFGADIDFSLNFNSIPYLKSIIADTSLPEIITSQRSSLDKLCDDNISWEEKSNIITEIDKNYEDNKSIYDEYLKEKSFEYKLSIKTVQNSIEYQKSIAYNHDTTGIYRDKFIYDNILALIKEFPGEKFFGQFGSFHVNKAEGAVGSDDHVNTFATMLNTKEDSPFKNKVLSIKPVYINCSYLQSSGPREIYQSYHEGFKDYVDDGYVLFKLNGDNSPFKTQLINAANEDINGTLKLNHGVTTDYYDYLLVISNFQEPKEYKK